MIRKAFSSIIDNRIDVLITGGTGSLGRALIELIYSDPKYSITILSRDELKQKKLLEDFPRVKCVLGDVRDKDSLKESFLGKTVIFHFAAMKHVDICEENLDECFKINLIGSVNVAKEAILAGASYCVLSSTDKSVLPINAYGYCKAFSERYFLHKNRVQDIARFSVFRWGNVVGSRGSVIPEFLSSLKKYGSVRLTDQRMTRFWIEINQAARFMLDNYDSAPLDNVAIPVMKSARMIDVIKACATLLGIHDYKTKITGIRAGEKLHECLFSSHESCLRSDGSVEYDQDELMGMIERIK